MSTHEDAGEPARLSPEIVVYATNKSFLNIYDALAIERVKVEVARYDPATRRQLDRAGAYLPVADVRLLCHLVVTRQFAAVLPAGRFERFGGGGGEAGVESRVVTLEYDPGADGKFARFPYRLTVAVGPGERTATGAIQPKGSPTHKVDLRLPEPDLLRIALTVQAYLAAYDSAHHAAQVAARLDKQTRKRAQREARTVDAATGEIRDAPPSPVTPFRPADVEIHPGPCTPDQITAIAKGFDTLGYGDPERRVWLSHYHVTAIKQLSVASATQLHLALQQEYKARRAKGRAAP
jgi:hypothetical protein